ncbi:MAG: peptidoglycan-binding protein, partial [Acidobacteria bacterium]|nr:peptidoglycan-binding protein [Acidobacteriota bacterium]
NFGAKTEAAVRAFQRTHRLTPDGIVGPRTWRALDSVT